ncbi:RING finger protein unkempt [Halotydeus destructor]|nr:RING finger protein unkempt [Halotydeus destructor]
MPSSGEQAKASGLLQTQPEKPIHYTYLKEFRVEQCPLFQQHKCTQHKPFTCFHWHFNNQRRRRPVRKRDGTFNYSPDVYCTKFDETTGLCPEADDCPYLHRTAGDTERRYHLRYYKTGICVYDTDNRGYCVKNGPHCAFAHGIHDLRNPVYDVRELQAMENGTTVPASLPDGYGTSLGGGDSANGPNSLDKERNALNEDPRWQDSTYVLANYKTELCKRPPRLCRQGYACPQFHNNKDKRRSPKQFKYRSTPCPNVKQGDEWGDPVNCEAGENCPYCHTRTEQQFHPEIYKSTKCNDMQQTGYCPRGPFCAFAHVEKEMTAIRDLDSLCHEMGSTPHSNNNISITNGNGNFTGNGSGKGLNMVASSLPIDHYVAGLENASIGNSMNQFEQRGHENRQAATPTTAGPGVIARPRSYSTSASTHYGGLHNPLSGAHMSGLFGRDKNLNSSMDLHPRSSSSVFFNERKSPIYSNTKSHMENGLSSSILLGSYASDTVESVVGSAMEDLNMEELHNTIEAPLEGEKFSRAENDNSYSYFGSSVGAIGSTAPMNIPGARPLNQRPSLGNSSPVGASPLASFSQPFISPFAPSNSLTSSMLAGYMKKHSPPGARESGSSIVHEAASRVEVQRLKQELAAVKTTAGDRVADYENLITTLKHQLDEARHRELLAEKRREEAMQRAVNLEKEMEQLSKFAAPLIQGPSISDIENMSIIQLQQRQKNLRAELDCVDKVSRIKITQLTRA